ncbi:MAG: hypothetical protein ACOX5H_21210 [Bacillus licheniformis]
MKQELEQLSLELERVFGKQCRTESAEDAEPDQKRTARVKS